MTLAETICGEIANSQRKQADIAFLYATALSSIEPTAPDWREINTAILNRWSMSGLEKIKAKAWKIAQATAA